MRRRDRLVRRRHFPNSSIDRLAGAGQHSEDESRRRASRDLPRPSFRRPSPRPPGKLETKAHSVLKSNSSLSTFDTAPVSRFKDSVSDSKTLINEGGFFKPVRVEGLALSEDLLIQSKIDLNISLSVKIGSSVSVCPWTTIVRAPALNEDGQRSCLQYYCKYNFGNFKTQINKISFEETIARTTNETDYKPLKINPWGTDHLRAVLKIQIIHPMTLALSDEERKVCETRSCETEKNNNDSHWSTRYNSMMNSENFYHLGMARCKLESVLPRYFIQKEEQKQTRGQELDERWGLAARERADGGWHGRPAQLSVGSWPSPPAPSREFLKKRLRTPIRKTATRLHSALDIGRVIYSNTIAIRIKDMSSFTPKIKSPDGQFYKRYAPWFVGIFQAEYHCPIRHPENESTPKAYIFSRNGPA
ncbi:Protein of unknown function [Gryllus bimaculatus]|nr:Protein of unknown function [Gryllus bimaculatus]